MYAYVSKESQLRILWVAIFIAIWGAAFSSGFGVVLSAIAIIILMVLLFIGVSEVPDSKQ